MKRRFGRRRSSGGGDGGGSSSIDSSWLQKIVEAGLVPVESLTAVVDEEVPGNLALLGSGTDAEGKSVLVAFSPKDAGDAVLGLVAHCRKAAASEPAASREPSGDEPSGEPRVPTGPRASEGPARAFVVSRFSAAARRRLAFVGECGVRIEPVEAGRLLEGPDVQPEPSPAANALPPAQVGAGLSDPVARDLFGRALASLAGLAAKHAGGVRGTGAGVELVLMARRVARLSVKETQVLLEVFENRTAPMVLNPTNLAESFDQLEGQLRKRLRDNRILRGEEGLRSRVQPGLAASVGLRTLLPFPLGGSDGEILDAVGVGEDGRVVVVAVRERLGLDAIGPILDAWSAIQPSLPGLLGEALPPVLLGEAPRLVVASVSADPAAVRVLEGLTLALVRLDIRAGRDGVPELVEAGSAPASAPAVGPRDRDGRRRGRGRRGPRRGRDGREAEGDEEAGDLSTDANEDAPQADVDGNRDGDRNRDVDGNRDGDGNRERGRGRGRGRGNGGRNRRGGADRSRDAGPDEAASDDSGSTDAGEPSSRGANEGRRRRPGRDDTGSENGDKGEDAEDRPRFAQLSSFDLDDSFGLDAEKPAGTGRGRGRRRGRGRKAQGGEGSDDEESEPGADAEPRLGPKLGPAADAEPAKSEEMDPIDEEDLNVDEEDLELAEAPEPEEEPEPLRVERPRRAAILAHADRHSVAAAMLLAREARQVEGIWVYPQEELMTFFRSVTTDLRDDVTIIVVGFQASPARDVLQAASLYAGRLEWYDTREWPPEVLAEFTATLGTDFVDVRPGLDTPMPLILPRCSRRSRFSDKLVDLASARFTEHDFQRWGRVWWWRLADIASRPGEHKNELQRLLTGRPSDLAAEAENTEAPPAPPEVEYVSNRDFRIIHFGGYALVLVEVPEPLERSLSGRIARERYGAQLSVTHHTGDGLVILGATDGQTARPLAVGSMANHLGQKLAWVETLPGDDHVARFRIHGLAEHPDRLESVLSEIGMGRSILEG